eukprot:178347-Amphidinium_carterae.1
MMPGPLLRVDKCATILSAVALSDCIVQKTPGWERTLFQWRVVTSTAKHSHARLLALVVSNHVREKLAILR